MVGDYVEFVCDVYVCVGICVVFCCVDVVLFSLLVGIELDCFVL